MSDVRSVRLPRPYIPLRVRCLVAERQLRERWGWCPVGGKPNGGNDGHWLALLLKEMFGDQKVELHHRPALVNRTIKWAPGAKPKGKFYFFVDGKIARYDPDANDPDYLVYLPADEHDIETRVRGQHGQHSDLALARKRKRKERKARRAEYCRHPFERLLEIRGSLMCGVCHKEVDCYGSPLHEALIAWQEKRAERSRAWPKRKLRSRNDLQRKR